LKLPDGLITEDMQQQLAWRRPLVEAVLERKFDDEVLVTMMAGFDQAHAEGVDICKDVAAASEPAWRVASTLERIAAQLGRIKQGNSRLAERDGFEPTSFRLKGGHPKPLDERSIFGVWWARCAQMLRLARSPLRIHLGVHSITKGFDDVRPLPKSARQKLPHVLRARHCLPIRRLQAGQCLVRARDAPTMPKPKFKRMVSTFSSPASASMSSRVTTQRPSMRGGNNR
jgi:hypothetical protein